MKFKRLVMTAAIAGAVGAGPALAGITGVPGEALLVPLWLNSDGNAADAQAETYVSLYVPDAVGTDTVFDYTAPNTNGKNQVIPEDNRIYWRVFDARSKGGLSGFCDISLGDKVVWTTDNSAYRDAQRDQNTGILGLPASRQPPLSTCGPEGGIGNAGYVVFQTIQGARGETAPYAMYGNAWIVENVLTAAAADAQEVTNLASVPVIPMADSADAAGNQLATFGNEITARSPLGQANPSGPYDVRPHSAGIRLSGGGLASTVTVQGEIRGPLTGSEQSMHVLWFSNNSDTLRSFVQLNIWDDQEGSTDYNVDLSDELNILLWNHDTAIAAGAATPSLDNVDQYGTFNANQYVTYLLDVIGANAGSPAISGKFFNAPPFWNDGSPVEDFPGAINGYVEYLLPTETDANGFAETAVAFQWNEILQCCSDNGNDSITSPANFPTAWSSDLMTDLGKK